MSDDLLQKARAEARELMTPEQDTKDAIDGFLKEIADRWDTADHFPMAALHDCPPAPGCVSIQMLIDELRSRISV